MKIITIVGARPQFIKAATVSRAIAIHNENTENTFVKELIIHTGQHYDANMSDIFFDALKIPKPDHNLEIGGGPHGQMTGRQLEKIEKVLLDENPDVVLVYGDTNSTLAGALAASKLNIKLAHVEAGLRSYNRSMPEEINRLLTDHISDILFTPTHTAAENLLKEGIGGDKVKMVGDVMYDATKYYKPLAVKPSSLAVETNFVLCTIHRAENTNNMDRLRQIFEGLSAIGKTVVLPLHPRTKSIINENKIPLGENIVIIDPVGYLEMNWLEAKCSFVVTDSGGVQKEAYFHNKFCLTMRDETEWVELVDAGFNILVGASSDMIKNEARKEMPQVDDLPLYGDGDASKKIVDILVREYA